MSESRGTGDLELPHVAIVSTGWYVVEAFVTECGDSANLEQTTMATALTSQDVHQAWTALTGDVRTAVLLTLRNERPFGSHVPYVFGSDWTSAYLHLSRLALHTQHLLENPQVALFIAEPDGLEKNPLALRRLNLQGEAAILSPDTPTYEPIKRRYLERFPQAEMMFSFGDFSLWELRLAEAHFVLGFGQAFISTAATPAKWVHQKVERPSAKKE